MPLWTMVVVAIFGSMFAFHFGKWILDYVSRLFCFPLCENWVKDKGNVVFFVNPLNVDRKLGETLLK